jgi:hypothetical protein
MAIARKDFDSGAVKILGTHFLHRSRKLRARSEDHGESDIKQAATDNLAPASLGLFLCLLS